MVGIWIVNPRLNIHWYYTRHICYIMYLALFSLSMAALLLASMKISVMSLMSVFMIWVLPPILALIEAGVRSWEKDIKYIIFTISICLPERHSVGLRWCRSCQGRWQHPPPWWVLPCWLWFWWSAPFPPHCMAASWWSEAYRAGHEEYRGGWGRRCRE